MDIEKSILAIDVGSGTQDILIWQPNIPVENCPKLILPSSTTILARRISQVTEKKHHIFLIGKTMGGGPCSSAIRAHIKAGLKVFSLPEPALTLHDDINKVKKQGIQIVGRKPDLEPLTTLQMGDIDLPAINRLLQLFEIPEPEIVAVSVQDHGFSPTESNRAFRFEQWRDLINSDKGLESLLYETPPDHLTRMRAVKKLAPEAWTMDTGASAILGVFSDPWVSERGEEGITIINIGNEHTLAALVKNGKIWGIYEHHTSLINPEKLKKHLKKFRQGELSNKEIFSEMGHGCLVLPDANKTSPFKHLSITGPNRGRFQSLGGHMAAPYGDMMLTGCFGLVEAVKKRISQNLGERGTWKPSG